MGSKRNGVRSVFSTLRVLTLLLILAAGAIPRLALAESRIALVVGNGNYSSVSSLNNPENDAVLISETLRGLGFEVTLLVDANQAELRHGISQFGSDLREAGQDGTGLFYYAGHALQSFGNNYLLPVDANLTDAADLSLVAIEAEAILRQMFSAKNRTNIVILDSCRNNPFENIPELNDNGLAEMKAPAGTFLAYATEPGGVALDGLGVNSPFTQILAREMMEPGAPVEQVFKKVRVAVRELTNERQTPWDTSSLISNFTFLPGKALSPEENAELQLWNAVRSARDLAQVKLFLDAYPNSRFGPDGRKLLAALMEGQQPEKAETSPTLTGSTAERSPNERLLNVQNWMFQLQDLDEDGAIEALAATEYDMLVIEAGYNFIDWSYDTAQIIDRLKVKPDGSSRLLLAYVDIGQAEDYRNYWLDDWVAPTAHKRGHPDFMITIDPDGWSGNFPVAYWDNNWQSLWLGSSGIIADLARFGFDGVLLDWVEAYDDDRVREAAREAGVSPENSMITFIEKLGDAGKAIDPSFLVVAQNAIYLIDADPDRYTSAIDALAVEDTWFHGWGDSDWDDPDGGDQQDRHDDEYSTSARLVQIALYQKSGLPVFSVDYALNKNNVAKVYNEAIGHGLISLVTRVALSKLTETPPPSLTSE
ncbi:caspase family protein [Parasedimentitalea marina]|uniref:caspase family protein n=1 Tax=Parasedimentitalea marina TaxID=2483033 RepID=UPI0013E2DA5A|nr:caspase family protein [Parasedimentitalea marina]